MTNLFENINTKNIDRLKKSLKATSLTYPKGVNILSNVNRDDFIAIVEAGNVQLFYHDYEGNKILLEEIQEGEIFSSYTTNVYAEEVSCLTKEETQITYIEYPQITSDEIIRSDSYILFIKNLIKMLTEQISLKNTRIEILTKRSTRDKLLEYFKFQAKEKKNKSFTIPFSFTELANYLSVDRSAMTRELKYLKQEGFIKTNGRRITLLY